MHITSIILFSMAGGFLLSSILYIAIRGKSAHVWPSGLGTVFAFITMMIAVYTSGTAIPLAFNVTVEQIVCWSFALLFFVMAFYWIKANHIGYAFATLLISVAAFFVGLAGVQTLLKTHLLHQVTASLKTYGEKIDKFQSTVTDMNDSLLTQEKSNALYQVELTKIQTQVRQALTNLLMQNAIITTQFQSIFSLQGQLKIAQTKLEVQQEQIGDVEYLVRNIYQKVTNETFTLKDTTHTLVIPNTNNSLPIVVALGAVPVANSVRATIRPGSGLDIPHDFTQMTAVYDNIVYIGNVMGADSNTLSVRVEYVIDTRRTNVHRTIPGRQSYQWIGEGVGYRYQQPKVGE